MTETVKGILQSALVEHEAAIHTTEAEVQALETSLETSRRHLANLRRRHMEIQKELESAVLN